jgi:hypothetical protein
LGFSTPSLEERVEFHPRISGFPDSDFNFVFSKPSLGGRVRFHPQISGFQVSSIPTTKPGFSPSHGDTCIILGINKFDCRKYKGMTQFRKKLKKKSYFVHYREKITKA